MIKRYVCGFMSDLKKEKIALITKARPKWQEGLLNAIGGSIEDYDITPTHAIQREFLEETGYSTSIEEWIHTLILRGNDYEVYFFKCSKDIDLHKELHTTTDEEIGIYDLNYLPFNVIPNLKWIIPFSFHEDNCFPITVSVSF